MDLTTIRTIEIVCISTFSMLFAQGFKFVWYSIRDKKLRVDALFSTGGAPSSHTAFCMTLVILLGAFQIHDIHGLHWSFAVAFVFMCVIIHDAMGIRLEASKHAEFLNRFIDEMSDEERAKLGVEKTDKEKEFKEKLGHKGNEVIAGAMVAIVVSLVSFFICIAIC